MHFVATLTSNMPSSCCASVTPGCLNTSFESRVHSPLSILRSLYSNHTSVYSPPSWIRQSLSWTQRPSCCPWNTEHGGLGIHPPAAIFPIAYLASWAAIAQLPQVARYQEIHEILTADLIHDIHPRLGVEHGLQVTLNTLFDSEKGILPDDDDFVTTYLQKAAQSDTLSLIEFTLNQKRMTQSLFKSHSTRMITSLQETTNNAELTPNERGLATWKLVFQLSARQKFALDCFKALPVTPDCRISSQDFTELLRLYHGLPFTFTENLRDECICDKCKTLRNPTQNGYHFLACKKSACNIQAHTACRDFIHRWTRTNLGVPVTSEPQFLYAEAGCRERPDLKLTQLHSHPDATYIDFTSVHSYAVSHRRDAVTGKLFKVCEDKKRTKYARFLGPGELFVPFVMDVLGGMGPAAQKLLGEFGKELEHDAMDPMGPIRSLRYGLACTHRKAFISCTRRFATRHSQCAAVT